MRPRPRRPPRAPRAPFPRAGRAWTVLALGLGAQISGTVFVSAPAFLIPLLHSERGLTLAEAGLLASTPTIGMVLTLIAWGALADRIGEKWVIAGGLALTALAAVGAIQAQGYVALGLFFFLGGAASASANAASGRVVVGWFPKDRRGLAMGVRQMAQPLGVTIAALLVPGIAASAGVGAAIAVPFVLTAVFAVACAIGVVNPPRASVASPASEGPPAAGSPAAGSPAAGQSARAANPYRANGFLWRIHAVSVLLVVPQFTLSTFGLVWLITEVGLDALSAGILVGVSQFVGAIGRIAVGVLSDRVGSRVRPLAWVAVAASVAMLVLAALDAAHWGAAAVVFVIATTISVADNGLAFTSVAEVAGSAWAGRALGAQNTAQFLAASVVGPGVGALIGLVGFPLAFGLVALFPAAAVPLIPRVSAEQDRL
ncbi:MFS transporter [Herbiconiux daphne]|uniref:MFS transporter n=1 Tax=Herbiconiux daphne TaxID=2970914 RepID=A0ABT2H8V1_9MICO|nr:MFS transporter [Herbiconiux daphne]MCS5736342.1 MFS transporter [Herbiconiux daphne]